MQCLDAKTPAAFERLKISYNELAYLGLLLFQNIQYLVGNLKIITIKICIWLSSLIAANLGRMSTYLCACCDPTFDAK